uniref:Uncharacterized protein LOC111117878 isoform X1 n=1 Tax=Crassostrea virginica TaxID=6565 RepID=A0A8B8CCF4_CRAVI|nr:uncharacterized protein LOC111117878 isoform X1 [Crassostrea virginica]
MGSLRLKYIVFILLSTNQMIVTSAAVSKERLLLATGIAAGALLASQSGYYTFSPEAIALLTSLILVTVLPSADQRTISQVSTTNTVTNGDEGVGPRDAFIATETPSTCTTSGYALHPVLGCIRYYTVNPKLTPPQWKAKCAADGGKLILIDSEKENQELVKLLEQNGGSDSVIQGSRKTSSSPWVTDAGTPLPYTADFLGLSNVSGALNILASSSGKWVNVDPSNTFSTAVCEI